MTTKRTGTVSRREFGPDMVDRILEAINAHPRWQDPEVIRFEEEADRITIVIEYGEIVQL